MHCCLLMLQQWQKSSEYQHQRFQPLIPLGFASTRSFPLLIPLRLARTQSFQLIVPLGLVKTQVISVSHTLGTECLKMTGTRESNDRVPMAGAGALTTFLQLFFRREITGAGTLTIVLQHFSRARRQNTQKKTCEWPVGSVVANARSFQTLVPVGLLSTRVISARRTLGTREDSVVSGPGTLWTREDAVISAFRVLEAREDSHPFQLVVLLDSRGFNHSSSSYSWDCVLQNDWYWRVTD